MSLLRRLRGRSTPEPAAGPAAPGEPLPLDGYDRMKAGEIVGRLHELTQVELSTVETHEREHEARPQVLHKLSYLRRDEPMPGYDELEAPAILAVLADADAVQVKEVRDYERKFRQRRQVLDEAARVLPDAGPNAVETKAREAKLARVRASMRRPR